MQLFACMLMIVATYLMFRQKTEWVLAMICGSVFLFYAAMILPKELEKKRSKKNRLCLVSVYVFLMVMNKSVKKQLEREMAQHPEINKYKRYLLLEKGLSPNTIEAYMTDLQKLSDFCNERQLNILSLRQDHLEEFLATLYDKSLSPRSTARIISGMKSFFRFLLLEHFRDDDPSELLESPKIGLKLPVVLSVEEIDAILAVIDLSTAEGTRNYAILETLYSCGLRISELTNLRFSDLFLEEGFIRVEGKGSKQRLVPISDIAIQKSRIGFLTVVRLPSKGE